MNRRKQRGAAAMGAAILACSSLSTEAAGTRQLGQTAPPLAGVTWIKGEPVSRFEPGKVYVVEFWATWCGPCHALMPRLSALQKKHAGRLKVIGVNARETDELEGAVEGVKTFVAGQGEKMAYTIAMDNPVTHPAFDSWMSLGGSYGIPTAFIVSDGKLVWVGNPTGKAEAEFEGAVEQAVNRPAPH